MKRKRSTRSSVRYPAATLAAYGPDNTRATKLVVSVLERPGQRDPFEMRVWTTQEGDVRREPPHAVNAHDVGARGTHRRREPRGGAGKLAHEAPEPAHVADLRREGVQHHLARRPRRTRAVAVHDERHVVPGRDRGVRERVDDRPHAAEGAVVRAEEEKPHARAAPAAACRTSM